MKTKVISAVSALLLSRQLAAGPFSDIGRMGDLLMVMTPAYAWGMTMMEKDYAGTIQLGKQLLATQAAVEGIKMMKLEKRPSGGDMRSFPSGHAAGVFSGAMFVHKRYGWKPALIPYGMAIATGWTRVRVKAHYWHDVLAGAAVSALFTWAFVDRYDCGVSANAGPGEVGLSFKASF
jgi:membrane-associated phospholipid phosphatase